MGRRFHWCAGWRNVISSTMGAPGFEDWMETSAGKSGTYPGKLDGEHKKAFAEFAIGSVISTFAVLSLKT